MAGDRIGYLHGTIPVRILGSDFLVLLVERVDGKPLDAYGLAQRDWIAKGAIHDHPALKDQTHD